MCGGNTQHAHDAGFAIDLDVGGVAEEGGGNPRLHTHPADTGRAFNLGSSWNIARAGREQLVATRGLAGQIDNADALVGGALDTHKAVGNFEVAHSGFEPLGRHFEEAGLDHVGSGHDSTTVVEGRLRTGGTHVVRASLGVLIDDREVLGLHAENVGGKARKRHHGARSTLHCAGHDRRGPVTVELDVRTR